MSLEADHITRIENFFSQKELEQLRACGTPPELLARWGLTSDAVLNSLKQSLGNAGEWLEQVRKTREALERGEPIKIKF
jgi:hypothetical protein